MSRNEKLLTPTLARLSSCQDILPKEKIEVNKRKRMTKIKTVEIEVNNVDDDETKQSSCFAPSNESQFQFKPKFYKPSLCFTQNKGNINSTFPTMRTMSGSTPDLFQ